MAITKEKKAEIVKKVEEAVSAAETTVFLNFHGLKVADSTALRKELRAQNVGLLVAKKTLIRRALAGGKIDGDLPELPGEVALAYGTDQLAPARGIYEFEKRNKDAVRIVGGIFENRFVNQEAMLSIATIPGREVLYAKLVNLLNSPIQRVVVALDQIAKAKELKVNS